MRKVIVFNMVTLDGFLAGPNGELDWHNVDEEFNIFANQQLDSVDMLLFGRKTYEMMASYWPTPTATENDPITAEKMNTKPKIVFSKTLQSVDWSHTRLVNDNLAEEMAKLKQQPGKDLIIFGSSDLIASLAELSLIDEYRLMVNPLILGSGKLVFCGIKDRLPLKLVQTRPFHSGNVLLVYQPDPSQLATQTSLPEAAFRRQE